MGKFDDAASGYRAVLSAGHAQHDGQPDLPAIPGRLRPAGDRRGRRREPARGPGGAQRLPGAHGRPVWLRPVVAAPDLPLDGDRSADRRRRDDRRGILRPGAAGAAVGAAAGLHRHLRGPLCRRRHGAVAAAGDGQRDGDLRRGHGPAGAGRPGRARGQGPVPGGDEPRDPHAPEWRAGGGRDHAPQVEAGGSGALDRHHSAFRRDPASPAERRARPVPGRGLGAGAQRGAGAGAGDDRRRHGALVVAGRAEGRRPLRPLRRAREPVDSGRPCAGAAGDQQSGQQRHEVHRRRRGSTCACMPSATASTSI